MKSGKKIFFLGGIIFTGFVIRLFVIIHGGYGPHHEFPAGMDEVNYRELASNILDFKYFGAWSEGFFTRSTRSPGYPALLAFCHLVGGGSPWSPQILNIALDTFNIFLIFLLCGKISCAKAAWCGSLLYAFFGPSFIYLPLSVPEILSLTLVLSVCICLVCVGKSYKYSAACLVIIYSFLIHTRPVFLIVIPFLALGIFAVMSYEKISRRIVKTIIPCFLIIVCCVPWGVRNYKLHKAVVPVCTIAGWHLFTNIFSRDELSVKILTDHIYDPHRVKYTEGDYFREGAGGFRKYFASNPLKTIFNGSVRLVRLWSFPGPAYRFILPKAYVAPVRIGEKIVLPFPDFEGLCYLFFSSLVIALLKFGKSFWIKICDWLGKNLGMLIFIFGYAVAHIIGIPLEQYRFIIEPVIVSLELSLLFSVFVPLKCEKEEELGTKIIYIPLAALCVFLCLSLILPCVLKREIKPAPYPSAKSKKAGNLDFCEVRKLQWDNVGNIPENTRIELRGIVKYFQKGIRFNPDENMAVKDGGFAAAKMYVNYLDARQPLGIGDCKLNFDIKNPPENGNMIRIEGFAKTGKYKDIIVNVESWEKIP